MLVVLANLEISPMSHWRVTLPAVVVLAVLFLVFHSWHSNFARVIFAIATAIVAIHTVRAWMGAFDTR
jgi:hypothetical protein